MAVSDACVSEKAEGVLAVSTLLLYVLQSQHAAAAVQSEQNTPAGTIGGILYNRSSSSSVVANQPVGTHRHHLDYCCALLDFSVHTDR